MNRGCAVIDYYRPRINQTVNSHVVLILCILDAAGVTQAEIYK